MNYKIRSRALEKLAFFGSACVIGAPSFQQPQLTVGQAMYDIGAYSSISGLERRKALDDIVSTGLNVNSPAKRLFNAGIGALAGGLLSKVVGASPFMKGVAVATGANYGYNA